MSDKAVDRLSRDLLDLRDEVRAWGAKNRPHPPGRPHHVHEGLRARTTAGIDDSPDVTCFPPSTFSLTLQDTTS